MNIIKNAHDAILEHTITNGKISIVAYEKDGMYHITVEDNAGVLNPILFQRF